MQSPLPTMISNAYTVSCVYMHRIDMSSNPTVPSAVFMYSTFIIVSYAYLVCYDYILVMPTHVVSIACLISYALPYYACPVSSTYLVFYTYAWYAVPTCLSSHPCIILVLLYSLLWFGSVQHFMCTVMFSRLEPNMLKNLPIIFSQTSQNFYLLFLFYSQGSLIIPFLFHCVNDIITMQDWLYIVYIVTDCFNRIFDCSIRVSQSFAN